MRLHLLIILGVLCLFLVSCDNRVAKGDKTPRASAQTPNNGDGAGSVSDPGGAEPERATSEPQEEPKKPKGNGAASKPKEPYKGPLVPCFWDADGKVLMRVDGVPVHESTFKLFRSIYKARDPGMTPETVTRTALEDGIIPVAALYAKFQHEVPELSRRAYKAYEALKSGKSFKDVMVEHSDDPNRTVTFGSQGIRRRLKIPGLAPVSPILEDVAMKMPIDGYSKPFCTHLGVIIASAKTETAAEKPEEVQREIFQMLFSWNQEYADFLRNYDPAAPKAEFRLGQYKKIYARTIENARVEVVDESVRKFLYPYRIKK